MDTKADILAHWAALLDGRNTPPAAADEMERHTCQRCGKTFMRRAGAARAPECPICRCKRWDDPGVTFRAPKGKAKRKGGAE